MTDPNHPSSTRKGGPNPPLRDPIADREGEDSSIESSDDGGGGDPDALDQSVGREDAGQGDSRSRDGAI